MKGLSDNFLQKFDNLGLRNKEIDKQDEQQYNSQKKTASTRNIEKQELTIRDFNIYTTLGKFLILIAKTKIFPIDLQ